VVLAAILFACVVSASPLNLSSLPELEESLKNDCLVVYFTSQKLLTTERNHLRDLEITRNALKQWPGVDVVLVDAASHPSLRERFQLKSLPRLHLFHNGMLNQSLGGLRHSHHLLDAISEHCGLENPIRPMDIDFDFKNKQADALMPVNVVVEKTRLYLPFPSDLAGTVDVVYPRHDTPLFAQVSAYARRFVDSVLDRLADAVAAQIPEEEEESGEDDEIQVNIIYTEKGLEKTAEAAAVDEHEKVEQEDDEAPPKSLAVLKAKFNGNADSLVLFVPDIGFPAKQVKDLASFLAFHRHNTYVLDLSGSGDSDGVRGDVHSLAWAHLQIQTALIEMKEDSPGLDVVLVGHGLSTLFVTSFVLANYPTPSHLPAIKGIALFSPQLSLDLPLHPILNKALHPTSPVFKLLHTQFPAFTISRVSHFRFSDVMPYSFHEIQPYKADSLKHHYVTVATVQAIHDALEQISARLPALDVPLLAICPKGVDEATTTFLQHAAQSLRARCGESAMHVASTDFQHWMLRDTQASVMLVKWVNEVARFAAFENC